MSDCCAPPPAVPGDPTAALESAACPACGSPGRPVETITLKALLRASALPRLGHAVHRFCASVDCDVVYFAGHESYGRHDVRVPVFQKQTPGRRTVCYCFDVGEEDLRREAAVPPREPAFARITRLVGEGRCACEVRNPQGTCCLGNVSRVMAALEEELGRTARGRPRRGRPRRDLG